MQNDRQITISCGNSRKAVDWRQETLLISELWDKLRVPARGKETVAQYLGLKKPQQDELKDVGGFVGGSLNGPRRKARNVTGRDIITLDFDNIPPGGRMMCCGVSEPLGAVIVCTVPVSTNRRPPDCVCCSLWIEQ